MKNATRIFALLSALLLLFSSFFLPACGDAENGGQSGQDSGAADPSAPDEGDDLDRQDTVFPGEDVPRIDFGSFENYKTFLDLVKKGGSGPDEAVAFARENFKFSSQLDRDAAIDCLKTVWQAETLAAETENVKILLPQSEDWTLSTFSRGGSSMISDGNGGFVSRFLKKSLGYSYRNEELGIIGFDVYYDDATRNHTPRQFYRWGTGDGFYEYSCKYVSPDPYFTLPFATGETLTVFRLDDESANKGFLFTDNSEIIICYTFQNFETDQLTAPTKEEKEALLRSFFEGARVVTLAEAAG